MRLWFVCAVSILAIAGFVGGRGASGIHGAIAFSSDRDGSREIYTMRADGSNVVQITNDSTLNMMPAWSPDKTKIAFISDRDGNYEVYVMNSDGSNQVRLTANGAGEADPVWSPDGAKIAFTSNRDGNDEIYVINANGTGLLNLTNNGANDFFPDWSPDGTKIAFSSTRPGNREIYAMNSDGSNPVRLTSNAFDDSNPVWSPDGTKIALSSDRDGNHEIYSMNSNGTNAVRLTFNTSIEVSPCWSPDGSNIAFTSVRDGNLEVYVMDSDGSNPVNLSNSAGIDDQPVWAGSEPVEVVPSSFSIIRGLRVDGGLADLFESDDRYLLVRQGPRLNNREPFVEVIVEGIAPEETAAFLLFRLEASCNGFPSAHIRQRVDLYNYEEGRWEVADERPPTPGDSIVEVRSTVNASRFIQPGTKRVKARIGYFQTGVVISAWGVAFDQTIWQIAPG